MHNSHFAGKAIGRWPRCAVGSKTAPPKCAMELQSTHEALSPLRCCIQPVTDIVPTSIDRRRCVKPLLQRLASHRIPGRNGHNHDPLRCLAKQFFQQELLPDVARLAFSRTTAPIKETSERSTASWFAPAGIMMTPPRRRHHGPRPAGKRGEIPSPAQ